MGIPETVYSYWQHCIARGERPRKVWMLVSLGNVQPKGYVMGWGTQKRHMIKEAENLYDRNGTETELVECPAP